MSPPIVEIVKIKLPDDVAQKFSHRGLEDYAVGIINQEVNKFITVEFNEIRSRFHATMTRELQQITDRTGIDEDDMRADVTASESLKIIMTLMQLHPSNQPSHKEPQSNHRVLRDYARAADLSALFSDKNADLVEKRRRYLSEILIREYLRQRDVDVIYHDEIDERIAELTVKPHSYDNDDCTPSTRLSESFYLLCGPAAELLKLPATGMVLDGHRIVLLQLDTTTPSLMTDTGADYNYIDAALNWCIRTSGGSGPRLFWNQVTDDFTVAIRRFSELLPLEPKPNPRCNIPTESTSDIDATNVRYGGGGRLE